MNTAYEHVLRVVLEELALCAGLQAVDAHQRLGSLGLDSITITDLVSTLERRLDRELEPTIFWRYATPEQLCRHLCDDSPVVIPLQDPRPASAQCPIAITGLACCFPHAADSHEFWRLLIQGQRSVGPVGTDHFNERLQSPWNVDEKEVAGFISHPGDFDAQRFGLTAHEASQMDPQQRLMLTLTWAALEQAAMPPASLRGQRGGVFIGAMWCDFAHHITPQQMTAHSATGLDTSILSARISFCLGLSGPSMTVNTACSSSLVALHLACQALKQGECDFAVVGGVNLMLAAQSFMAMRQFGGLSATATCHTFDAAADGYVRAEGAGVVIVRRLPDALVQAAPIWGVVRSSVVNNNGFHASLTAPSFQAQQALLDETLQRAGVTPDQVEFVEAHGTGTAMGDPIEVTAIAAAYCPRGVSRSPLLIGSVKTNIGHSEAAAGMAGLIKVLLALQHGTIPAHLNYTTPNPAIDWAQLDVQPVVQNTPWRSRRPLAGVSSFGFGGTNAHVIIDRQWPATQESPPHPDTLVVKAARSIDDGALLVFSGQGDQWQGMGLHLARLDPVFRQTIADCDRVFATLAGWSLAERLYDDLEDFTSVEVAWPCHFAVQVALARVWIRKGLKPTAVVGHSIGEAAAAHIAGMLSLHDALVVILAQARWAATQPGAMALLDLGWSQTEELLTRLDVEAYPAIQHAGQETVISGSEQALAAVQRHCHEHQVRVRQIQTRVGVHAARVEQGYGDLTQAMQDIVPCPARIPVYGASATGAVLRTPGRAHWDEAVALPLRWFDALCSVLQRTSGVVVEISSHPVLQSSLQAAMLQADWHRGLWISSRRGGSDACAMDLALADGASAQQPDLPRAYPLLLSGYGREALRQRATSILKWLQDNPELSLSECSQALCSAISHERFRVATVITDRQQAIDWLRELDTAEVQSCTLDHAVLDITHQCLLSHAQCDELSVFEEFSTARQRVLQVAEQAQISGDWLDSLALAIGCVALLRANGMLMSGYRMASLSGKIPDLELSRSAVQALLRAAQNLNEQTWQAQCIAGGEPGFVRLEGLQDLTAHQLRAHLMVRGFLAGALMPPRAMLSQPPLALPVVYGSARAAPGAVQTHRLNWQPACEEVSAAPRTDRLLVLCNSQAFNAVASDYLPGSQLSSFGADDSPDFSALAKGFANESVEHVIMLLEPDQDLQYLVRDLLATLRFVDRLSSQGVTLHVFTVGAYRIGEGDTVWPESTLLWGVLRTALLEFEQLRLCVCDLPHLDRQSPEFAQWAIAMQASVAQPLTQSAWRAQQRYIPTLQAAEPPPDRVPSRSSDTRGYHLITGGLGALGQALLEQLIDQGETRFVLIGRQPASEPVAQALQRWREQGNYIVVECLDVSDAQALDAAVQRNASTLGPLTRISHLAGTLEASPLQSVDGRTLLLQMRGKQQGAWNLHRLSEHWPIEAFVLISSVSSLFGFPGHASYAAANAYLDGLADYRRGLGLPGISVRFGPFQGNGLLANGQVFGHLPAMTLLEGLQALRDCPGTELDPTIMKYRGPMALGRNLTPPSRPVVLRQDAQDRHGQLADVVRRYVAALLQQPIESIPDDAPLSDLGISSLLGVEIRNRLQTELEVRMPATVLWNYPTVNALASYLESLLWPADNDDAHTTVSEVGADEDDDALMAELLKELATIQEKFNGANF
ncbi:SDR family NAD(P)-dependent oxidoreductase [Pseudomonas sp. S75]|uniref:type I polyketide synthase n=1 Tax=unclassified Pseudomonas TaxID=196821 RepID=UPI0019047762|nr:MULTISPECIES: type I polyketide synthase [unclassified Pseudomonas]MBJ9975376.1 SDR family NAD(P)-dependent oxidoreductase [Pseudomonas sp. S30]MBK0152650.1 SDR family NAD(P)-dependent oxidoreductase [Pseudomonas sp. S75]